MSRRISRLQKAGEDLYLRRKYEEAITVFQTILALDESDMSAKLWMTKTRARINREKNELKKQELYRKHGQLIPKEMIYHNWHWGPSVGHFEVRYSEPKPYVRPERKFHPRATDEEVAAQKKKAEASGSAEDYFELSMRYWSRKEQEKAVKAFFTAVSIDREVLANDDELLLTTVNKEVRELIESEKAKPADYMDGGRVGMIQGNRKEALQYLINAARLKPDYKDDVSKIIASYITSPEMEQMSMPADIFSYRQAYVFDDDADMIYLRIVGMPRQNNYIFPLDITLEHAAIKDIKIVSDDLAFAYAMPGIDSSARLWFVLPRKKDYYEYELKLIIYVDRKKTKWVDLSNFSIPPEQPDNWSFVIGSEFNFGESLPAGEYEKNIKGVKVAGYHLSRSDGKGPYLDLNNFIEPMPEKVDIWELIEGAGQLNF